MRVFISARKEFPTASRFCPIATTAVLFKAGSVATVGTHKLDYNIITHLEEYIVLLGLVDADVCSLVQDWCL